MKFNFSLALFTIALFFFACSKEDVHQVQEEPNGVDIPADLQATIDEAEAELEYDYNNPPVYEGLSDRGTVYVPAGSTDALADAIKEAGWGGKVVLRKGDHYESGTVMITQSVKIYGEDGAKLYFDNLEPFDDFPQTMVTAIHIKEAYAVWIKNVEIYPSTEEGSMAIFLEKGLRTRIEKCKISGFKYSIWLSAKSNGVSIYDNKIYSSVTGIDIENGTSAKIKGNYFENTGGGQGIFASDKNGIIKDNEFTNATMGVLLCTIQPWNKLPNGEISMAAEPAKNWKVIKNTAYGNTWNYMTIDGANNNSLFGNLAWDPGLYDIELVGPTERFGFPAPTSYKNFVVNPNNNITVKDCGENNVVLAGDKISVIADPCF